MKKMTKKNLTWKLKEMPTGGELAELVDTGVISKEEAREIMFGSPENDKEKIEALEKLVDFLQDLVKEMSKNKSDPVYIPYVKTLEYRPTPYWDKYWMNTEKVLCESGLNVSTTTTTKNGMGSFNLAKVSKGSFGDGIVTSGYASSSLSQQNESAGTMTMTVSSTADKEIS